MSNLKYSHAAVGGTFDRLHAGHHELLKTAFNVAKRVTIGLTSNQFVSNKILAQIIEPYEYRKNSLMSWLSTQAITKDRFKIIQIDDIYGPSILDGSLDLLVVSPQTQSNAIFVNQKRLQNHLPPLFILVTKMIYDSNQDYLSLTQIRSGVTNRRGDRYDQLFNQDQIISSHTLSLLHTPHGEQVINPSHLTNQYLSQFTSVWVVGDVVTDYFVSHQLNFERAIIDGKTQRKPHQSSIVHSLGSSSVSNPPHTISAIAAKLSQTAPSGEIVFINGEEDLLALVGVLTAPLNSAVFYGRPKQGVGMINLTEDIKSYYYHLLNTNNL